MKKYRQRLWIGSLLLLAAPLLPGEEPLPLAGRTNGVETLQVLDSLKAQISASSVLVGKAPDAAVSSVVMSTDGYLLTKASEANSLKPFKAFLQDGTSTEARLVKRDEKLDLLLLKIERADLPTVLWGESLPLKAGEWLISLGGEKRQIRLGVVSAKRRAIPNSGAVLGVRMGADDDDGVFIEEVAEDSPAQRAGLKAEDLVVALDDQPVKGRAAMQKIISARHAGDVVKVGYLREGKPGICEVRLASASRVLTNWAGEDFGNHGTSVRTDNFPEVIQHSLPLSPADMGSALFNLQGRAVALNIARVDRVTNFALPVESFLSEVLKWIRDDQAKTASAKRNP